LVAVYRLGKAAMNTRSQVSIAIAAAVAALASPVGVAGILLLAGGVGLWLFHSRKLGATVLVSLAACLAVLHIIARSASVPGVLIWGASAFLPSFVMLLAILPALDRVGKLVWTRAALRGIAPAVIGILAVSLVRLAPYALPDLFAIATLVATVVVLMLWREATLKIMLLGAVLGIARSRLFSLSGAKALLYTVTRACTVRRSPW